MSDKIEVPQDTVVLDLAIIPEGWDIEKWISIMKNSGICVIDSYRSGAHAGPAGIKPYMLHSRRTMKYQVVELNEYNKIIKKGDEQ